VVGGAPDGCPPPDGDGDGFPDRGDKCPDRVGVAPLGCPAIDSDSDTFLDHEDACPQQAGVGPDGCPIPDADQDLIADREDACPVQAETRNGVQDSDGCPDELPDSVKQQVGVVAGLEFEGNGDKIRPASAKSLDALVQVLKEFPALRLLVTVHTDDVGKREDKVDLSRRRAESVKQHLVAQGIDAGRIETRGAGPDEPVAKNNSEANRRKNRRVEISMLPPAPPPAPPSQPTEAGEQPKLDTNIDY
jgi:OOP family OmpA-OmpF porin